MEDRELTLQILTATQVANAQVFYTVLEQNPLLAKLMLDKLKQFLTNDYFATMERQTVLMRFLEDHTNLDVIKEVLEVIEQSELKQDYFTIIAEWTYHNSEIIVQQNLAKYDGSLLCLSKDNPPPSFQKKETQAVDEFVGAILELTKQLLLPPDENDGDITL